MKFMNLAVVNFFTLTSLTDGGMACKGVRAKFLSTVTEIIAGQKLSQPSETLMGYTACWQT
ncbi:hypothetical protein SDC9_42968 [bioreactor metagenome]|uniref:Uncharacterized protein n=1 Tax=bioreactor metagenome TaxID=1076179 RepID=A0A644VZ76_9ZZZZ